ncbi:putative ribonuclease P protein subunit p30 [Paratrimastix pyriformis]|uniref:Ribonuclease P protein subunit p30 n=1 Tax=Paratrimastix pyriformis TaxID=342808 RepID=A0ABQ8ULP7_9EUKA|nr:putative ribonuclease P protein subunit p30 [Paratrimastix pyriformis]
MFYDLSVPFSADVKSLKKVVMMLFQLGYDGIALNHIVNAQFQSLADPATHPPQSGFVEQVFRDPQVKWSAAEGIHALVLRAPTAARTPTTKKKAKRHADPEAPSPSPSPAGAEGAAPEQPAQEAQPQAELPPVPMRTYRRLSIHLEDGDPTSRIHPKDAFLQDYDLVAVQPHSEKMFLLACTALDVDLISLDCTRTLPFRLRVPTVRCALGRGVRFELQYGPAITDAGARRSFLATAQALVTATGGRGIVLSSGTSQPMALRAPHDLANLLGLVGLDFSAARQCLSARCEEAILKGASRHTERGLVSAVPIQRPLPAMATGSAPFPLRLAWRWAAHEAGAGAGAKEEEEEEGDQPTGGAADDAEEARMSVL